MRGRSKPSNNVNGHNTKADEDINKTSEIQKYTRQKKTVKHKNVKK